MRNSKRAIWDIARDSALSLALAVGLVAAAFGAVLASDHEGLGSTANIYVVVDDGRLSVEVGEVPLKDVLEQIADQTGVRVSFRRGDPGAVRPQTFSDLPLVAGIERLIGDRQYVLLRDSEGGAQRLREVWVYGEPGGDTTRLADAPRVRIERTATATDQSADTRKKQPQARIVTAAMGADRGARLNAIRELAREKNVAALARYLNHDEDPKVRGIAAKALGMIRQDVSARALSSALGDPDAFVRVQAIQSLRNIKGAEAVPIIGRAATSDKDPEVRRASLQLLARYKGTGTQVVLEKALSDPSEMVRQTAQQLLAGRNPEEDCCGGGM